MKNLKRDLDVLVGRLLCRLERHDWVFVRRRQLLASGHQYYRTDVCIRCGEQITYREVNGVRRELANEER